MEKKNNKKVARMLFATVLTLALVLAMAPASSWASESGGVVLDAQATKYGAPDTASASGAQSKGGVTPQADTGGNIGSLTWTLGNTGILRISGNGPIPNGSNNQWLAYIDDIREVIIESGVTSIGNLAFYNFANMYSVIIPSTVTYIGINAFGNCTGLYSVTIPKNVTTIDQSAFSGCTHLSNIGIRPGVTSVGRAAFRLCKGPISIGAAQRPSGWDEEWDLGYEGAVNWDLTPPSIHSARITRNIKSDVILRFDVSERDTRVSFVLYTVNGTMATPTADQIMDRTGLGSYVTIGSTMVQNLGTTQETFRFGGGYNYRELSAGTGYVIYLAAEDIVGNRSVNAFAYPFYTLAEDTPGVEFYNIWTHYSTSVMFELYVDEAADCYFAVWREDDDDIPFDPSGETIRQADGAVATATGSTAGRGYLNPYPRLSGLSPGTDYVLFATAYNGTNYSEVSSFRFTTQPPPLAREILLSVAGQPVTYTGGDGDGLTPYRASVTVPYSKNALTRADIAVTAGLEIEDISNLDFDETAEREEPLVEGQTGLNVGDNRISVYVYKNDGESNDHCYYEVTVTRQAESTDGGNNSGDGSNDNGDGGNDNGDGDNDNNDGGGNDNGDGGSDNNDGGVNDNSGGNNNGGNNNGDGGNNNGGNGGGQSGGSNNGGGANGGADTGGSGAVKPPANGGTQTKPGDGIGTDSANQTTATAKPPKTKITKIKVGKRQLTVTWKKLAKSQKITKYQVRYTISGKKSWKIKTVA